MGKGGRGSTSFSEKEKDGRPKEGKAFFILFKKKEEKAIFFFRGKERCREMDKKKIRLILRRGEGGKVWSPSFEEGKGEG